MPKTIEEKIFDTLTKQAFANWYGLHHPDAPHTEDGRFERYLTGDTNAPSKKEILADIRTMFRLGKDN